MFKQSAPLSKARRNRLSPYTSAERRMNKLVVFNDADPIVTRHIERGLSRKSLSKKPQMI